MKIVFCEDDPFYLNRVYNDVTNYFKSMNYPMPEVSTYTNGDDLINNEKRVDIAFLDIETDGISGIKVGYFLYENNPNVKIFFITNYPDYIDEALNYRVFRYLVKPIDKHRLLRGVREAIKQYYNTSKEICISTKDQIITIDESDVIMIKYQKRKTHIFTTVGEIVSLSGIGYWRSMLSSPCFYQSYKSQIVNMRYIRKIEKYNITLMCNGAVYNAYLSSSKLSDARRQYLIYKGEEM